MTRRVVCQVCNNQRAPGSIHRGESKLLKGHTLLICDKCTTGQKEPRAFIILVARTGAGGRERVEPWIRYRRYEGPEITDQEIAP